MKTLTLATLLALASAPAPAAAPALTSAVLTPDGLRRERLPADVKFVLHLDVESLMSSEVGRMLVELRHDPDSDLFDLDEIEKKMGVDLLRDVHAMTLYQIDGEDEPTIALFATSLAVDNALVVMREQEGFESSLVDGIEVLKIHDGGGDEMYVYAHPAKGDRRVVVVAGERDEAVAAARVLRGEVPNHAGGSGALRLTPAAGSFLYVAAGELPDIAEHTPASQVFGLAQGIQVDLGEAGGFLIAHLSVLTELPERAQEVANVVQGLVSMGSLALMGEAPEVVELLRELRVRAKDSEVAVDFRFAARRLFEILRSVEEHEDEHDEGHEHTSKTRIEIR